MIQEKIAGIAFSAKAWPPDSRKPTVVFIHGSGEDRTLWRGQMVPLNSRANTVAIDLPGHGRSDGPAMDEVPAYARAVAAFIESASLSRVIPCGLSIGGAIVQQLLLDHAGPLAAGILVNTGARLRVMPAIFQAIEKDFAGFIEMTAQIAASPKTDPARLADVMAATAQCPPKVTAGDFRACDRFDVMDRLGEIQHPVLVVSAEEDKLTPPKYGDFLEKQIAGARRAHIADAGHLVPVEQADAFNEAVAAFLDTIFPGAEHAAT